MPRNWTPNFENVAAPQLFAKLRTFCMVDVNMVEAKRYRRNRARHGVWNFDLKFDAEQVLK